MICAFFGAKIMTQAFFATKPVTRLEQLENQLEGARIRLAKIAKTADNDNARILILDEMRSFQHQIAKEKKRPSKKLDFPETNDACSTVNLNQHNRDANDPDQNPDNAFPGMTL